MTDGDAVDGGDADDRDFPQPEGRHDGLDESAVDRLARIAALGDAALLEAYGRLNHAGFVRAGAIVEIEAEIRRRGLTLN